MYHHPRPVNVYHLGVTDEIGMHHISKAFDSDMKFILKYFLSLPQSCGKTRNPLSRSTSLSTDTKMPTLGTTEAFDANVFSPPSNSKTNLTSKVLDLEAGMNTPGATVKLQSILEENVSIQETSDDASYNKPYSNNGDNDEDSDIVRNKTEAVTKLKHLAELSVTQSPKGTNLILENK